MDALAGHAVSNCLTRRFPGLSAAHSVCVFLFLLLLEMTKEKKGRKRNSAMIPPTTHQQTVRRRKWRLQGGQLLQNYQETHCFLKSAQYCVSVLMHYGLGTLEPN
jgi:hypothetical protein